MAPHILLVNGRRRPVDVEPGVPLLWVLRDNLGLTGTKYGCGVGACGACTVRAAMQGRSALDITFSEPKGPAGSSAELLDACRGALDGAGSTIRSDGDVERAFSRAARVVAADYEVPLLAHVPMEPVNCLADVREGRCVIVGPMQDPGGLRAPVAQAVGIAETQITVRLTRAGGGFGRRLMSDYGVEAALLSKEMRAPVPLDASGRVTGWSHPLANSSRYAYALRSEPAQSEMYADDFPAGCVENVRLAYTHVDSVIPRGAWRSTLHSSNAFAVQSFVDELAHVSSRDPVAFRLELLGATPGTPLRGARRAGVRHRTARGALHLRKLWRRGGRGLARRRRRGSGRSRGRGDRLRHGRESERSRSAGGGGNSRRLELSRFDEAPRIDVHFVKSGEPPTGLGEPPLPPAAPALANAIFALTGRRVRRLPIIRRRA